jgi:succinate dehydrogenase hydrophobic anchor subunit
MLGLPGIIWKLVALALIWAYLHHFIAGLRHLWMDVSHAAVSKEFGKTSAMVTLVVSIAADAGPGRQAVRRLLIQGAQKMAVNYGSKRIVVGAHYGLRDWLAQRVTAVLMALFTVAAAGQVIFSRGPIGYDKWAGIFRRSG